MHIRPLTVVPPRAKRDELRPWSRLTIQVDVAHDGDLEDLEEVLALEVEAMILRMPGVGLMDLQTSAVVVEPGDAP